MFYFVYILRSKKDGKLYTGLTSSLEKRLIKHNNGKNFSTKSRIPFELLFYEALPTREEATIREKFYKSGRGREIIKQILFKTLKGMRTSVV